MKPKPKGKNTLTTLNIEPSAGLPAFSLSDYPAEIQPILAFLKENQLPVVIVVNVVHNNQSISNVTQSTISGCNVCGDYNTLIEGNDKIIGNNTNGGSINGKLCLK